MTAEIDSDIKELLAERIEARLGESVRFANGCYLSLTADQGMFWGESPYGTAWGCAAQPGFSLQVVRWLSYWDAPRTETGALVNDDFNNDYCQRGQS